MTIKGHIAAGAPYSSMDQSGNVTIYNPDGSPMNQSVVDQMVSDAAAESAAFHAMDETQQRDYLKDMIKESASNPEEEAMVDALFAMFGGDGFDDSTS